MARISLFAFASAEIINHHNASDFSVEKPIVVPWKFSRARRSPAPLRAARRAAALRRARTIVQSTTADVGHRFGSIANVSSQRESRRLGPARQRLESAATLRIARSAVGSAEPRTARPSTNATSACSIRRRSRSGISKPASCAIDST